MLGKTAKRELFEDFSNLKHLGPAGFDLQQCDCYGVAGIFNLFMRGFEMRTFPIVLSVLMISGYASADFVRPLKPNPVLCTGTNIEAGKDGLTLEINFTEKDGVIGTEGEYVFDKDLKFEKFNNAQAFNLAFEGNLYIQHLADGYNLLLNEGDLNEIAQGVQDKQYKFKGTLNLQAHGKYNVFCYGFFEK